VLYDASAGAARLLGGGTILGAERRMPAVAEVA